MNIAVRIAVGLFAAVGIAAAPAMSTASIYQPDVVSDNPADWTPQLVDPGTGPKPRVDAMAQLGSTLFAAGLFTDVKAVDGSTYARKNMMAFNASTGSVSTAFKPTVDGNVFAVEATTEGVYIGGSFTSVDGVARPAIAKLNPATGALDTTFSPPIKGGRVNEIKLVDGRLIVGGSTGSKLMALDPTTGRNTGYIRLPITDKIPGARGGVSVFQFAVNPAGDQLIATGNLSTVDGKARRAFFMLDLGPTAAALNPWYYPGFAKECAATKVGDARRIANLQGVDYSPGGKYFVVTATGRVSLEGDVGVTVCDAAARFEVASDAKPTWINYTGGDSVWATAATGSAVYVQGHFKWLDNPNGSASQCPTGETCAFRRGAGAIDPVSGKALPWNPNKPAQIGGKDFLATSDGLWIGSDSVKIKGEPHRGIGFMPLR